MIRLLILDDEPMAVKTLTLMVEKYIGVPILIRGESDFEKSVGLLNTFRPDLVLLDIMMPPKSGFDLLEASQHRHFHVIFTTAYDAYAIQAIRYSALDYLLKPISATELKDAFDRFFRVYQHQHPESLYQHLFQNLQKKTTERFTLAIPTLEKTYFIHPDELIRCESESNYTWFYIQTGEKIIASKTMKSFESILLDHGFIRIHRSHLVNRKFVESIEKHDMLRLKDGTLLPLARKKKFDFLHKQG